MIKNDDACIKVLTEQLVKAWETAEAGCVDEIVCPDAFIDISMFGRGISRDKLRDLLSTRPRKTAFAKMELMNYLCWIENGKAQQSVAMTGVFADPNDGRWTNYVFEGMFANSFIKTEEGWKFSAIKFEITGENLYQYSRIYDEGFEHVRDIGDASFVSHWPFPARDDRIGWYRDSRLPVINAETDAPWYVIKHRENLGTDEEQIQEIFFQYAYGMDMNSFRIYEDLFTDDATIIYSDTQPYDKRSMTMFLKFDRQGTCRCVHTGFHTDIKVKGDTAQAKLYLVSPLNPVSVAYAPWEESLNKRLVFARYKLDYAKQNGKWKIQKMRYYPGVLEK